MPKSIQEPPDFLYGRPVLLVALLEELERVTQGALGVGSVALLQQDLPEQFERVGSLYLLVCSVLVGFLHELEDRLAR